TLPSLRERVEDIGLIIASLLGKLSKKGADLAPFAPGAVRALLRYRWPGNVRELENCLRAALLLAGRGRIELSHLAPGPRLASAASSSGEPERLRPPLTEEQLKQREELATLLTETRGNLSAVARQLGKDRAQLQRWLRRLELDARTFRR